MKTEQELPNKKIKLKFVEVGKPVYIDGVTWQVSLHGVYLALLYRYDFLGFKRTFLCDIEREVLTWQK